MTNCLNMNIFIRKSIEKEAAKILTKNEKLCNLMIEIANSVREK